MLGRVGWALHWSGGAYGEADVLAGASTRFFDAQLGCKGEAVRAQCWLVGMNESGEENCCGGGCAIISEEGLYLVVA